MQLARVKVYKVYDTSCYVPNTFFPAPRVLVNIQLRLDGEN